MKTALNTELEIDYAKKGPMWDGYMLGPDYEDGSEIALVFS